MMKPSIRKNLITKNLFEERERAEPVCDHWSLDGGQTVVKSDGFSNLLYVLEGRE